jgi:hypothetical protein
MGRRLKSRQKSDAKSSYGVDSQCLASDVEVSGRDEARQGEARQLVCGRRTNGSVQLDSHRIAGGSRRRWPVLSPHKGTRGPVFAMSKTDRKGATVKMSGARRVMADKRTGKAGTGRNLSRLVGGVLVLVENWIHERWLIQTR